MPFFFFFFATPTDHQSPVDAESIAGLKPPFRRVFFLALQIALFAQIFLFCEMGLNTANLVKEPCHLRRKDSSFLCVFLNLAETAISKKVVVFPLSFSLALVRRFLRFKVK